MEERNTDVGVAINGKSMVVAYLLWWFLGWAGIHRFYLGRMKTGLAQLILNILGWLTVMVFVGFAFFAVWGVWWLLDAYFVQKMVAEENEKLGISDPGVRLQTQTK